MANIMMKKLQEYINGHIYQEYENILKGDK